MKKILILISLWLISLEGVSQFYIKGENGFGKFHPDKGIVYNVSASFGRTLSITSGDGYIDFYPEAFGMIQSSNRLEYGLRIGMGIPIWKIELVPYAGFISIEDTVMGRYQLQMKRAITEIYGANINYITPLDERISLFICYNKSYKTDFVDIGLKIILKKKER